MLARRNSSNRIEVDLKLLQDRNIEKLQEFGKLFDKSIGTLATMLGSFSEQVEGAQKIAPPGDPGPNASDARNVRMTSPPARMGGVLTGSGFSGGFVNMGGGGASIAPPSDLPSPSSPAPDEFERQWIDAQKRIGEHIPVGFREALGYAAAGQFKIPFMSPDRSQATAKKWNSMLFNMSAIKANMMLGAGKVQDFFGTQQAYTALGQSLGRSREGGFLGIGNSAWTTGLAEQLKTGASAWFGFDPYYSLKQAQEARTTLQSYGYSGDTSDRLASMLKDLTIHQGLDPKSAMSILDPLMRFGGTENLGQLTNILKDIPNAAYAAKMNLQQFTEELISTAQQVSQTTGMTVGNAARGLSAFSAVTGLAPSRASSVMTDPAAAWMAVGLTHSNLWDVTNGPHAASDRYLVFQKRFEQVTNLSAPALLHLARTNHKEFANVMSRAQALYMQDPNFFGGLSPREWLNSQTRNQGKTVQHMRINESLPTVGTMKGMDALLHNWGGPAGENMSRQFEIWEEKAAQRHWKSPESELETARRFAESLIKHQERQSSTRAAKQVTLALTPEAAKLIKLLNPDTSQRNSSLGSERRSVGRQGHYLDPSGSPH